MEQGGPTAPRWRYRTTCISVFERSDEERTADKERTNKHLDQWADAGWELISANAVQMLLIHPGSSGSATLQTYSSYYMRHYFYWRKPSAASGAEPDTS